MQIKALSKQDSNIFKAIGIILIVFHNYLHWIDPINGQENEFAFSRNFVKNFYNETIANPLEFINILFSYLGHFGVQIFIFMSGIGLAMSMLAKHRNYANFFLHRMKKYYPMLIVAITTLFFFRIQNFQLMSIVDWRQMLWKFLNIHTLLPNEYLSINGPWWFLGLIFQLYLLFPLLYKIIKKYNLWGFISICIFSYLCSFLEGYLWHLPEGICWMANSIAHLPEFALGIFIALNVGKKIHPTIFVSALVIFVLGNFLKVFYYFTFLSVALLAYGAIVFINQKLISKTNITNKALTNIGKMSMSLFLVHGFFRHQFIVNFDTTWWSRLCGVVLFFIFVYGIAIVAETYYQWIYKIFGKIGSTSKNFYNKINSVKDKKFFLFIRDYFSILSCFFIAILIFYTINILFLAPNGSFSLLPSAIYYNFTAFSLLSLCLSVLYILLRFINKNLAFFVTAIIFSILVFAEISLSIYANTTASLFGCELIVRPIKESVGTAIASVGSLWLTIIITLGIIAGFVVVAFFARKIKLKPTTTIIISLIIIVLAIKFPSTRKEIKDVTVTNKCYFLVNDIHKYINNLKSDVKNVAYPYEEEKVNDFLAYNPDYQIVNSKYPMEREDNIADVLSPYFAESEKQPDIVIILVESLGQNMLSPVCFMPFLDSLSQKSLYWKNCFSVTSRSSGAIPAITGSVVSPHGFQFGTMPAHNSLISILNDNNYNTNAFYPAQWNFDCIGEYLLKQDIDYLSPLYEYSLSLKGEAKKKELNTWDYWGVLDSVVFAKTIEKLQNDPTEANFSLISTMTTHEPLTLYDKNLQAKYENQVAECLSKMDKKEEKYYLGKEKYWASFFYTDDCIKQFMNDYKKLANYENTIFIITGDHANNPLEENKLKKHYNIPLIIWSPLLKEAKKFPSIVTQNDITPTLVKLLQNKYNINAPSTISWAGQALDTSATMQFNNKHIFINVYSTDGSIENCIYKNYSRAWSNDYYKINEDLSLERITDENIISEIDDFCKTYQYIYRYVYENNKLIRKSLEKANWQKIESIYSDEEILIENPPQKPSESNPKSNRYNLLENYPIAKGIKKLKVNIDANFLTDSTMKNNYSKLNIICKTGEKTEHYYAKLNYYVRGFSEPNYNINFNLDKVFQTNIEEESQITVYFRTTEENGEWESNPNAKFKIENYKITFYGTK